MDFVCLSTNEQVAEIRLRRGKVNALNDQTVEEIRTCFQRLAAETDVRAVILTGDGPFFSFGFDIPEFMDFSRESFSKFLANFTSLYAYVFMYPKPVIAALNGHTIAGGCMLALACDHRIMVGGKAKISLNEITFGSSVFAGSVAMLKSLVGNRNAQSILYSGGMYSAEAAMALGLVDEITSAENLSAEARAAAKRLTSKDAEAFRSIKSLLREGIAADMARQEPRSIKEFVDIWYSEATRRNLQQITIRE